MYKLFPKFCLFLLTLTFTLTIHAELYLDEFIQIECQIEPVLKDDTFRTSRSSKHGKDHLNQHTEHYTYPHVPLLQGTSLNWSGYIAATSLTHPIKNSVTAVSGEWIVPELSSSIKDTYCSIWVGIDGYAGSTVEQIGTEHNWSEKLQQNYAWFEMYPNSMYRIVGFPVDVNDHIAASVSYVKKNTFKMTIINHTKKSYATVPSSYTKTSQAFRNSAEWIVEAPTLNNVLPLAHFGTISLANCKATINGFSGNINSSYFVKDALSMITQNKTIKASPSDLTGGNSFTVAWEHE